MNRQALSKKITLFKKGGHVTRYHAHRVHHRQNVAEHTFGVLWILSLLRGGNVSPELMHSVLVHDVAEARLGDIPAPMKRILRERLGMGEEDVIGRAESQILEEHGLSSSDPTFLSDEEYRHLKMADVLEGLSYCMDEVHSGNQQMEEVATEYESYFEEMNPTPDERAVMQELHEQAWKRYGAF